MFFDNLLAAIAAIMRQNIIHPNSPSKKHTMAPIPATILIKPLNSISLHGRKYCYMNC